MTARSDPNNAIAKSVKENGLRDRRSCSLETECQHARTYRPADTLPEHIKPFGDLARSVDSGARSHEALRGAAEDTAREHSSCDASYDGVPERELPDTRM
jgi:hypothetical protein